MAWRVGHRDYLKSSPYFLIYLSNFHSSCFHFRKAIRRWSMKKWKNNASFWYSWLSGQGYGKASTTRVPFPTKTCFLAHYVRGQLFRLSCPQWHPVLAHYVRGQFFRLSCPQWHPVLAHYVRGQFFRLSCPQWHPVFIWCFALFSALVIQVWF
jgi:hypothetical protein